MSAPNDGGSSTGVLLELARLLCARKNAETIWLAFFDGEEAFNLNWADPDNTYGSRQLAASLALSGDLRRVKAMILVDMVGPDQSDFQARVQFDSVAHRYPVVHGGASWVRQSVFVNDQRH